MPSNTNARKKKNDPKRTEVIVLVVLLIVLSVAAMGVGAYMIMNRDSDTDQIDYVDLAVQYVDERNYEAAIDTYWVALKIDPLNEELYAELGSVYEALENTAMAMNVYSLGFTRTQSEDLRTLINRLSMDTDGVPLDDSTLKPSTITFNAQFVTKISSFDYTNFCEEYVLSGTTSQDNKVFAVSFSDFDGTLYYYNVSDNENIINAATNKPMPDAQPNEISVNDLSMLFSGMIGDVTYEKLQALNLDSLTKGNNNEFDKKVVSFKTAECEIFIECDSKGTISLTSWNRICPRRVSRDVSEDTYSLNGIVINAETGEGVYNAQLGLYSEETSELLAEVSTDRNGVYTFEKLKAQDCIVQITAEDFIDESFSVTINDWQDITNEDFTISPIMKVGEIRIVLTWNETPTDLDSHLRGENSDGNDLHVYFSSEVAYMSNGDIAAELDVDDTSGFGPETTTIHDVSGSYVFYVLDYEMTGTMYEKGATVKIYTDNDSAPIIVDNMPSDVENAWEVCTINNGEVDITNRSAD